MLHRRFVFVVYSHLIRNDTLNINISRLCLCVCVTLKPWHLFMIPKYELRSIENEPILKGATELAVWEANSHSAGQDLRIF
jgi:hypothetical protein